MPLDPRRVKALFQAALDLPDPAGRPAFLDRECGGDDELRRRLDELLAAHDHPAGRAGAAPRGRAPSRSPLPTTRRPPRGRRPPRASGPRRSPTRPPPTGRRPRPRSSAASSRGGTSSARRSARGGWAPSSSPSRSSPVRRQVALKLIKAGMDSKTVLARFESERQALALMDHPHIARVLDAGTTDAGRPFFVMELVKGIPLTDYCDQHRLGLPERLSLFRQICSAVQHAHQKGIIHRDLKPTNILVESHDGQPVPKVIDFGLAKATSGLQLTEHSLYTAFGSVAGTPLYMAPEQASFNALDVDTRADIYALGVILYELLTGTHADPARHVQEGGAGRDAADDPRGRAADAQQPDQLLGGAAEPGRQPAGRAGAAGPVRAGRPRLDRDEGAGQGAAAAVRVGHRPGQRHRAVHEPRAGQRRAADGRRTGCGSSCGATGARWSRRRWCCWPWSAGSSARRWGWSRRQAARIAVAEAAAEGEGTSGRGDAEAEASAGRGRRNGGRPRSGWRRSRRRTRSSARSSRT